MSIATWPAVAYIVLVGGCAEQLKIIPHLLGVEPRPPIDSAHAVISADIHILLRAFGCDVQQQTGNALAGSDMTILSLAIGCAWMSCALAQLAAVPEPKLFAGEGVREYELIEECGVLCGSAHKKA
jgi:hypothetical protein